MNFIQNGQKAQFSKIPEGKVTDGRIKQITSTTELH